jgi:SH3 domain
MASTQFRQRAPHSPQSTISTVTTASTVSAYASRPRNPPNPSPGKLVRALYDYHSTEPTNLSFQAGTIIRVINELQSGWWDGYINGERGWFPYNFVREVSDDELLEEEQHFFEADESDSTSEDEEPGPTAPMVNGKANLMASQGFAWGAQAERQEPAFSLDTQNGKTSWELPNTKMFLGDWDESRQSDEEETPRSSLDSDNSGDVLMLGPVQQTQNPNAFNVPV